MTVHNSCTSRPNRATPATGATRQQDQRRTPEERRKSHEIHRRSPEGRPAHPEYRSRDVGLLLIGAGLAVVVASAIVSLTVGVWPGLVVLVFGLGLAVLLNPEIWATSLRAKERFAIEHEDAESESDRPQRQAPRT